MNKFFFNVIIAGVLISAPLCPDWIVTPSDLSMWLDGLLQSKIV